MLVDDQRGGVYPLGIAGWIPADQVTYRRPGLTDGAAGAGGLGAVRTATVAVPRLAVGPMTVSYGTRLPVLAAGPATVTVATPAGPATVAATALRRAPVPGSGAAVVAEAERFVGLPYLWAGTSAFGYDCSGLTYSVYRQFGIVLPRDALDQSRVGRPVSRADLQPGDLIFFSFGSSIDHVGIYAGDGMLIHAPHTGASVEVVSLSALAPWWAGATRLLPAA